MPDGTSVAIQKALVARLRGNADVTNIVPATDIFDRSKRPERDRCIVLGEEQFVQETTTLNDASARVYVTLHLWNKAQDFELVKALGDAVRKALKPRFVISGLYVAGQYFGGARYLRDPDGEFVHGVLTMTFLIMEPET